MSAPEPTAADTTNRGMAVRTLARFAAAHAAGRGVRLTADEVYALMINTSIGEMADQAAEELSNAD